MSSRLLVLPIALFLLCFGPATAAANSRVSGDFNGDGHDDLAVGVPNENVGSLSDAGAVNVIYGAGAGLSKGGNQLWTQDSAGIQDTAESFDRFGTSLAAGDFNADGFDDLAVGAVDETVGSVRAGAVNVIYGSASRLTAADNQLWHQDSSGVVDAAETFDRFGFSLTAGDFNADGFDDLAVGVDGESVGSASSAGAVNVIYGSASRLTATGNQLWHQDSGGIADVAESGDSFGHSLTAGDFNGDGFDDLAVGVVFEGVGEANAAGAVNVIHGSTRRLTSGGNQFWHQDITEIAGVSELGDRFGTSVAAGDFNGDGKDDLAVGVPIDSVGTLSGAVTGGAVNVIYGSASRLTATGNQLWHQDKSGIADVVEEGDGFGFSLTAGDFNASGHDDLAVGVTEEKVGSVPSAGAVNVIYGSGTGLRANDNQFWHQDSSGITDAVEQGDHFASSLTAGDFNASGHDDLAVGVSGEGVGSASNAGAVNVIHGSASRLTATGNQLWHQDITGIADAAEAFDALGAKLPA